MEIWDFLKGELIEIIEWQDDSRDILSWRFPDEDKVIKSGAELIVQEFQAAQFVYLGAFGDTFGPGQHTLTTDNIPILTRLRSWKFGLESPFKADLYFLNTRLFKGNKWCASNSIMMRDDDFGIVRVRAFGTYDFRVTDLQLFLGEVAGSDHDFRLNEFSKTMRSRIVSIFSDALATANVPVMDAATRFVELGEALLPLINAMMSAKYGIEIASFVVEKVLVPPEVTEAMDKRASMATVGNLNDHVKYQMVAGIESGSEGAGGLATEMAVGLAIAEQILQQQGGALRMQGTRPVVGVQKLIPEAPSVSQESDILEMLDQDQIASTLRISRDDVLAIIESGDLPAKKIGCSYQIKRSALEQYLAD